MDPRVEAKLRGIKPWVEPEVGQWPVMLSIRTGQVRVFRTPELAMSLYGAAFFIANVHLSADELLKRVRGDKAWLAEIWRRICRWDQASGSAWRYSPNCKLTAPTFIAQDWLEADAKTCAQWVWDLCQLVGDRVGVHREWAEPGIFHPDTKFTESESTPRHRVEYRVELDKLRQELACLTTKELGLPRQAFVIANGLLAEERSTYSPEELDKFSIMLSREHKLKTKQDPLRVVKYYLPLLADKGWVIYPRKEQAE